MLYTFFLQNISDRHESTESNLLLHSVKQQRKSRFYWKLGLMIALVFLAYAPVIRCGFIWDDDDYVTQNMTLRDVAGLERIWTQPGAVPQYYPMVHTTFWVEYHLWQLNPLGYHLVNVALHLLVALLWWRVLSLMGLPCSWLAAMLFAVHPVQVESVAWITERKNVLSGVFYLLTAWGYWRFSNPKSNAKKTGWSWYIMAMLCFIAALLSKSVTATLPAALILVLWYRKRRFPFKDLLWLLPMFILGLGMGLHTLYMETNIVGAHGNEFDLNAVQRFLLAGHIIWAYLLKILWPEPLVFFYPRWPILTKTLIAWLYPLGVLLVTMMCLKNRKIWGSHLLVCWLFFIGTLFPVLGAVLNHSNHMTIATKASIER